MDNAYRIGRLPAVLKPHLRSQFAHGALKREFALLTSKRTASEAKALEVDPMRNNVSSVAARLLSTSAVPSPAIHSGPSRCTIATDKPGTCASLSTCRSFCSNSSMEFAGVLSSMGFWGRTDGRAQAKKKDRNKKIYHLYFLRINPSLRSR